jgi:4-hydroxy-3-polyprenylbenzoate decarboxylase
MRGHKMSRKVKYKDLRDFLSIVESMDELKVISGAHWDKEMGAITEIVYREKPVDSPALLFDNIPGYPKS